MMGENKGAVQAASIDTVDWRRFNLMFIARRHAALIGGAMARVILHLGDHKTGTSSLQRLCAAGCAPPGVLYPLAGRANGAGHHNLAWAVGNDPRFRPDKGAWPEVWREVERRGAPTVLISSEAFEFKRPKPVCAAFRQGLAPGAHEFEAVIYLRPHAARLLSSFSERVKRGIGPFDRSAFLAQALSGPRFRYAPRVDRWRRALAPGPLAIRTFTPSELSGGDVVEDLFRHILHAPPPASRPPRANEAPGAASLRLMQLRRGARSGVKTPGLRAFERRPAWTKREAELIRALRLPDARALDDHLGGDVFVAALDRAVDCAAREDPCAEIWERILRRATAGPRLAAP